MRNAFVKKVRHRRPRSRPVQGTLLGGGVTPGCYMCLSPTDQLSSHACASRAQYNGVWHCFVGRNFGAYMTYEAQHHVYFYVGQMAVLLFKTVRARANLASCSRPTGLPFSRRNPTDARTFVTALVGAGVSTTSLLGCGKARRSCAWRARSRWRARRDRQ